MLSTRDLCALSNLIEHGAVYRIPIMASARKADILLEERLAILTFRIK